MTAANVVPMPNKTQRDRCQVLELGSLNEDIYEVGCAIGYVCDHGEQEQTQEKVDKKNGFRRGITHREVDDHNRCERQIVDYSAGLPELYGVREVIAQS